MLETDTGIPEIIKYSKVAQAEDLKHLKKKKSILEERPS